MKRRTARPGNHVRRALRQADRVWWAAAMPLDTFARADYVFGTYAEALHAVGDNCEYEIWHVRRERLPHLVARHNAHVRAYLGRRPRRSA